MSDATEVLQDAWAFIASHPIVAAACLIGAGGLILLMGAGRQR